MEVGIAGGPVVVRHFPARWEAQHDFLRSFSVPPSVWWTVGIARSSTETLSAAVALVARAAAGCRARTAASIVALFVELQARLLVEVDERTESFERLVGGIAVYLTEILTSALNRAAPGSLG